MESSIKNIIIFVVGAGVGAAISWQMLKAKYAKIAQEEIDSVKEIYSTNRSKKETLSTNDDCDRDVEVDKKDITDYSKLTSNLGYVSTETKKEKKEEPDMSDKPYVISPDEFDELDYQTETLTYYADGVLTDDYDNPIEDVEAMVGEKSLTHFGEYEDDSVYVRNDKQKIDYEILADLRNYKDVIAKNAMFPGDDE